VLYPGLILAGLGDDTVEHDGAELGATAGDRDTVSPHDALFMSTGNPHVGMLDGVNVALGVCGSIAAVKTVELAHELRRQGAEVRAVMTSASEGIIHPWSLEYATENEVVTEITGRVEHVELCGVDGWADLLLVAPATANTVGKMAAAVDDTPVTTCATTAFGAGMPVVVVPAMHQPMYNHPRCA
jgi:Phosphopantothenoylcysteine synthetase/decarboxylase